MRTQDDVYLRVKYRGEYLSLEERNSWKQEKSHNEKLLNSYTLPVYLILLR
jgi:hypothetical protein